MKKLFFLIASASITLFAQGQKQNNIWYFGRGSGINFNIGVPVLDTTSKMYTDEAAAVISDSNGTLLFYSNGITVWNRLHQAMDNGDSLFGCLSTTQTLIVHKPGNGDEAIYYLFTANCDEPQLPKGFRYNIIDMKQNGGLGKVMQKNILLRDSVTEKITAVTHANGTDFWVLAHDSNSNKFLTYAVTCDGLDTVPAVTSIGNLQTNPFYPVDPKGYLVSSHNGSKLAMAAGSILEMFDFDNATGTISDVFELGDTLVTTGIYGVCFSPDDSKLYVTNSAIPFGKIIQFDLLAGSAIDIANSKTIIYSKPCDMFPRDTCIAFGALQAAPDGKIYVAHLSLNNMGLDSILGVINNPNALGLSCNYVHDGFWLGGKATTLSLPNFIQTSFFQSGCYTGTTEAGLKDRFVIIQNIVQNELSLIVHSPSNERIGIYILNTFGKNVLHVNISPGFSGAYDISLAQMSSGFYFISFVSNSTLFTHKFLVPR